MEAKMQFARVTYVCCIFQLDQEFKRLDVPNTEELRKKHMRSWIVIPQSSKWSLSVRIVNLISEIGLM